MLSKTKQIFSICGIVFGLLLVASSFLISHAQKESETQNGESKVQDEQISEARAAVAKSVVGSVFLDTLSLKSPAWSLEKAGFSDRNVSDIGACLSMSIKKGDRIAAIEIIESDSATDADRLFDGPRSYGANVPTNKFGERSDKLVGQRGDFMAIRFREGRYFVQIWTKNDENTAKKFAQYVLDAIKS